MYIREFSYIHLSTSFSIDINHTLFSVSLCKNYLYIEIECYKLKRLKNQSIQIDNGFYSQLL